jgi:hypothetical protein
MRCFGHAGSAPDGPEVEQHILASEVRELHCFVINGLNFEIGGDLAGADDFPGLHLDFSKIKGFIVTPPGESGISNSFSRLAM